MEAVTGARFAIPVLVLSSACFGPRFNHPTCPDNVCPGSLICNAQQICDEPGVPPSDATPTPDTDADTPAPDGIPAPGATCWRTPELRRPASPRA